MTITQAQSQIGLTATATSTRNNVFGNNRIGDALVTTNFSTTNAVVYSVQFTMGNGGSATLDMADGSATGDAAGTSHVETATAAGTASGNGNVDVTLTNSPHSACNKTVSVAILNGDTAATWAGKVRAALAADADISAKYTVGGSTTAITLTDLTKNADGGFNIALANGTPSPGITPAASSTTGTAGVASVEISDAGVDFEGITLPNLATLYAVEFIVTGAATITQDSGTVSRFPPMEGTAAFPHRIISSSIATNAADINQVLQITATQPSTVVKVVAIGAT